MSFKKYAKDAKKRLASGFWDEIKQTRIQEKEVAATCGKSAVPLLEENKAEIKNKIYNHDFENEKEFERRVIELITSQEVLVNPIGMLANKKEMEQMSSSQRQAYLLKLASKYRQVKDKYYAKQKTLEQDKNI
ncbi:MAG: hypothetical protein RR248_04605 [Clostridia bacterium]